MADRESKRHPAYKAANAARALGVILVILGLLVGVAMAFAVGLGGRGIPLLQAVVLASVAMVFLAPGIALVCLSFGVRRGARAPTVAVLVIAILIAVFLTLIVLGNIFTLLITLRAASVRISSAQYAVPAIYALLDLAAILLGVHCVQSLRLPDATHQRGFEPLVSKSADENLTPVIAQPLNGPGTDADLL